MKQPTQIQKRLIEAILTESYGVESPVEYGSIPPNDMRVGYLMIAGIDMRVREYTEYTLVEPG